MISQNKVFIIGTVVRDPELKALPSGSKVCSLSVATNRSYKKQDGSREEQAEFHNVVVFGSQADSTATFMKKGSQVGIEGRLQTRSWDKDGVKHYRTEIVAENVQFGSKPASQTTTVAPVVEEENIDYPDEEINLEDIPF